ncbi:MAG: AzlD domain-containing protein [Clostridia bacterium]|nr:AzlD domain-containing protein [Clostridia bacterium]
MTIFLYILTMALVTYLIRMLPMTLFRKKIDSRFIKSVLYYIPYSVLSAMTFPSVFYSTGDVPSAVVGTVVALILAFFKMPMIVVALSASATALLYTLIF